MALANHLRPNPCVVTSPALRPHPTQNAQARAFQRVREKLEARMFLAKPDFCKCIMDLRGLLFEMNQAQLIDIKTDTAHHLRDLVTPSSPPPLPRTNSSRSLCSRTT